MRHFSVDYDYWLILLLVVVGAGFKPAPTSRHARQLRNKREKGFIHERRI
jgi:hypothetical protein